MDPRIYILRILAMLLIINTHLASLHPISALSFGGRVGNSIFYLVSGYGLALSYRREPLTAGRWLRKRLVKLVLPLVIILVIINMGNWRSFSAAMLAHLVWHSPRQLNSFMPVLLLLYALFLPLMKLRASHFKALLGGVAVAILGLYFYQARSFDSTPINLLMRDYYFLSNAVLCFMSGMLLAGKSADFGKWPLARLRPWLIALFILRQISHRIIFMHHPSALMISYYANIISVVALFLVLESYEFRLPGVSGSVAAALSSSSLAVYLVHSKIIRLMDVLSVAWPCSVIIVFLYSFMVAYPLMLVAAFPASRLLSYIERR